MDLSLRELERRAACGDPEAAKELEAKLRRVGGFLPCVDCGLFFPAYVRHTCNPETGDVLTHEPPGLRVRPAVMRDAIYDSEYFDGTAQTSFFVNYHTFNTAGAPRAKAWGVDTNLQGQRGIYHGHRFAFHRIAVVLPAGLDEKRRNWLLNETSIQIRSAYYELRTIPGLICYRDHEEPGEPWVIQIAGGPPEAPLEQRRGNEGLKGVDLTVGGRAGFTLPSLDAFQVLLSAPSDEWQRGYRSGPGWSPVLIRVVFAGFLIRDSQ